MLASETDKKWHIGYVSGSFDMFHIGHLNLIRRAKEHCDHLIVGVLADKVIAKMKKRWPVISLQQRMEIVAAVKYVDDVDVTTRLLLNKVNAWEKYHFDAMFSGDDHLDDGWAKEESALKALGADLVFFPYTKEISTTRLQQEMLPPKAENADKARIVEEFTCIFPFDKVNRGERIVIYGTGDIGGQYAGQLAALNYCEVVAFADGESNNDVFKDKPCLSPEELAMNMEKFDRVVVASVKYHDQILWRLRALGIHPGRIV